MSETQIYHKACANKTNVDNYWLLAKVLTYSL
jgi:hypothetical protein